MSAKLSWAMAVIGLLVAGTLAWLVFAPRTPPPHKRIDPIAGGRLFEIHCRNCHQEGGRAADLLAQPRRGPAEILEVVVKGRGDMPGFGGLLSTAEINDVLAFLLREPGE